MPLRGVEVVSREVDVSQLEPADRDPKKLRATALKIVLFMIVSGLILNYSYMKYQERTSDSERPTLLTKITEPEVELLTADGEIRNLQDLKGKVTLVLALEKEPAPESQPTLDALKEVMASFEGKEEKPTILVFVLDGSNLEPEKMAGVLSEYGSEPEVLRVVADQEAKTSLRSFMKAKMRFGIAPAMVDGKLEYDTSIVLLDQHLHVRGQPGNPFEWDFEKVARFEAEYEEALKTRPAEELQKFPITTPILRELLINSINYLYEHPEEKGQK